MKLRLLCAICTGIFALGSATTGISALLDRGGGLIYDTDLNVTWMQDANYAKTSGFDPDGRITWHSAMDWVASLTYYDSVRHRTWADWRLPSAVHRAGSDPCFDLYCTESEMGHLYYIDGISDESEGPFVNFEDSSYWANTWRAPLPGFWLFHFGIGKQDHTGPFEELLVAYVWPVRDGDVSGSWTIMAGRTPNTVTHQWYPISLQRSFVGEPVILASLETFHGPDTAALRLRNLETDGFEVRIEEEQSLDAETIHISEIVNYIALEAGLIYTASGSIIGEAGTISRNQGFVNQWHTVSLRSAYSDPVVLMNMVTYNDGDASHIRLRDVTSSSFDYQIEEWDYLDGTHTAETIAYVVLESGIHTLLDDTKVEVGTVQSNHLWTQVAFSAGFSSTPSTLSQSQTVFGGQAIVTRQRYATSIGFELRLQEEQGNDGSHFAETIGYVSVAP